MCVVSCVAKEAVYSNGVSILIRFKEERLPELATPSALPRYIQISERLIREIAAGRYVDGSRLPPEREMAAELGIAVGTLRKALSDLEDKGLLERIQGSGNYIRATAQVDSVYSFFRLERVQGGGLPSAEVLSVDRLGKPRHGLPFGQARTADRIRRLRRLDEDVIAVEEIWLDAGQVPLRKADLTDSLYLYYRERLGIVISAVEDRIGVAQVPPWADPRFGIVPGQRAAFIERLSRSETGETVEYSRTWFDETKARYVARMGKG